jgi:hypothetical protein
MIASPGDVKEEREIVTKEVYRWNDAHALSRKLVLQPVKWETHSTPQLGVPPQDVLNEQILDDADILIGIFGTRVGTRTEKYISGTVEEIKRHVTAGKTAKVYFSDVPVAPSEVDPEQYKALQEFKEECKKAGLYATYSSLPEFKDSIQQHLAIELNSHRYLWIPAPPSRTESPGQPPLSDEAKKALVTASEDDGGLIHSSDMGGEAVQAGKKVLTDGTVRSAAIWKEALKELESGELIEETAYDSGVYRVTGSGFRIADKLRLEEEDKKQLEIDAAIAGSAPSQALTIKSSKSIRIRRIEFLTTAGVCAANEEVSVEGDSANLPVDFNKVVKLFNTPRADRQHNDHSGPGLVRITYSRDGVTNQLDLPVLITPVFVHAGMGTTQYIALEGQKRFYI